MPTLSLAETSHLTLGGHHHATRSAATCTSPGPRLALPAACLPGNVSAALPQSYRLLVQLSPLSLGSQALPLGYTQDTVCSAALSVSADCP